MRRPSRAKLAATIFVLAAILGAPAASNADANVAPGGFRLGWYDALSNLQNPAQIAAGGMSMITAYYGEGAQPGKYLNAAQASGTSVMAEIPDYLVKQMDVETIKGYVALFKDYPALEGWHLADEPSVNTTLGPLSPQNAITLYNAIKSVDPVHPVSITFASGEDARPYLPALDVLQHDDYPFKAFSKEFTNLDRWKKFTYAMSYVAMQNGKPFIPILQAFGGSNVQPVLGYRAPTAKEMRYMVYSSLAALSNSMYFWTFYRRDPNWVSSTLTPLVGQIQTLKPALTAGYRSGVVSSSNATIQSIAFQDPTTLRWYVLAINHTAGAAAGSLTFSNELAGKQSADHGGTPIAITNNKISHTLTPYEARVYTID